MATMLIPEVREGRELDFEGGSQLDKRVQDDILCLRESVSFIINHNLLSPGATAVARAQQDAACGRIYVTALFLAASMGFAYGQNQISIFQL